MLVSLCSALCHNFALPRLPTVHCGSPPNTLRFHFQPASHDLAREDEISPSALQLTDRLAEMAESIRKAPPGLRVRVEGDLSVPSNGALGIRFRLLSDLWADEGSTRTMELFRVQVPSSCSCSSFSPVLSSEGASPSGQVHHGAC